MTLLADIYNEFLRARQWGDTEAQKCFTDVFLEPKVDKERDPFRLYATDIGKCPRQVAYRLLSTEKDYESPGKQRNDRKMYDVAEYIEAMLTAAFMWKGNLISHQTPVPFAQRSNWGGRTDLIVELDGHRRIIEVKTHRGNASNYTLPKPPHVHQASSYHWELAEKYELDAPVILWYVSRDGSGEPNEYEVVSDFEDTLGLMDELDYWRENLNFGTDEQFLPPQLDKVLQLRSWGKTVSCEPDWQCGYCDYAGTCKPDMSKSTWAALGESGWAVKKAADVEKLARWGEINAETMLHPLPERSTA